MTFVVEVGGRVRRIDVRRSGSRWQVTVDDKPAEVDVSVSAGRLSLLIGTRSYDVAVHGDGSGRRTVRVDGREVALTIGRGTARGVAAGGAAGPAAIRAPMPGRVVKLLVSTGDRVAAHQGVVVVEAMKMENELRAPNAGTVRELRVAEGALVEAGATLAVIEQEPV